MPVLCPTPGTMVKMLTKPIFDKVLEIHDLAKKYKADESAVNALYDTTIGLAKQQAKAYLTKHIPHNEYTEAVLEEVAAFCVNSGCEAFQKTMDAKAAAAKLIGTAPRGGAAGGDRQRCPIISLK